MRLLTCMTLVLFVAGMAYADNTAVQISNYSLFTNGMWTLGFEFTPNVDIDVTTLGSFFPAGADDVHGVTLWDTAQNVLATTTVTGTGAEGFIFGAISPVMLTHGVTYVVGATTLSDDYAITEDVMVDPNITYVDHVEIPCNGVTPCFPTGHFAGFVDFGANFQFTTGVATTPEPATLALLGTGLVGWFARRRFPK